MTFSIIVAPILLLRIDRDLNKRRRRRAVVDDVCGDPDIGVVGEHGITAVDIARTARKVAAGDIDLDAVAGANRVMYVREADGYRVHVLPVGSPFNQ